MTRELGRDPQSEREYILLISAYRASGNRAGERAALRRFLERYPNSRRAPTYQRRLESLEGG